MVQVILKGTTYGSEADNVDGKNPTPCGIYKTLEIMG